MPTDTPAIAASPKNPPVASPAIPKPTASNDADPRAAKHHRRSARHSLRLVLPAADLAEDRLRCAHDARRLEAPGSSGLGIATEQHHT